MDNNSIRDLDRAVEYELKLSERLQVEILKEYKSLDLLLERYEQYRSDESIGILQQSSFFEYYEVKENAEKKKKNLEQQTIKDNEVEEVPQTDADIMEQLPLLPMSAFLEKVGNAFAKLPQSNNE